MSHFTVMVIGNDVGEQLAPFQENNMGDCPEKFLVFNDTEERSKEDYESGKSSFVKFPDGSTASKYDNQFYHKEEKSDGSSFAQNKFVLPENCELVDIPFTQTYSTFEEYMKGYEGTEKRDPKTGKYGYWENPNAKWDWCQTGGRWMGFFKMKPALQIEGKTDPLAINKLGFSKNEMLTFINKFQFDRKEFEKLIKKFNGKEDELRKAIKQIVETEEDINIAYREGELGSPGTFGPPEDFDPDGRADAALKRDIDFKSMREEAAEKGLKEYKSVKKFFGGEIPELETTWTEFIDDEKYKDLSIEEKREQYHSQPALVDFNERRSMARDKGNPLNLTEEEKRSCIWIKLGDYQMSEEEYVENAKKEALTTFAVLKDGNWHERGSMGWWGAVGDEKEGGKWLDEINKVIDETDDNELFTIVDCHI